MKKIFIILFLILVSLVSALYLGLVFLLPHVINSNVTINKLQSLIQNKTGIETNIKGLNLKISPKFNINLDVDSIDAKNNNITAADIKNLSIRYKLFQKHLTLVSANKLYINSKALNQFKKGQKKKNKAKFELSKLPEIHIKNLIFDSDKMNVKAFIDTKSNKIQISADIETPYLNEIVKLGDSGSLLVEDNMLKANKFGITLGNSHLYLDGTLINKDNNPNFDIKGDKLPVSELMPIVLHLQKSQDPSKKFIENFKNFKGTIDVNLNLNKDGIWGKCIADNLSANAVWFNIPLFFKEAVFNFKGKTIDSIAEGVLGREKVIHTLDITKLGTPEKFVVGTMKTTLTKKFDYVPNLTVLNSVNISLVYKIKDKKPDVYYDIDIPANSDLIYNSFYLGLRNYNRQISANTFKDNNDLYLREYKYSYFNSAKENIILSGDGLFIKNIDKKEPDKFVPQYVAIRTNGYAPTSVIGAFGEKVRGGEFKGDLKYDFKNNQVLGTFDIIKARHKAFHIDQAHVASKNGVFNVTSNGFLKGEKYSAELSLKNNIYGETIIYNMKMFLDKLILETTPQTNKPKKTIDPNDLSKKVKESEMTINNWELVINEIKRDKFVLNDVKLIGSLKKNIFDFSMKDMKFADGIIHAKGIYDFAKNTSKMAFEAKNIDSNKVAEMTLNLKDQIEGIASAKVDIDAKDMFRFLDAKCLFEVKEGFMPGLADKEFSIQNTKYKVSEITNIDLKQKDLMKDDIKGSFDVHNTEINNINLTTWHEESAMFLEGNYEMEKQYADLQLFWHYSKDASKGIRIFGIPVSVILKVIFRPEHSKELYKSKLSQIPKIKADEKRSTYYRVQLKGNLNDNKTTIVLKEIR